jgi:enterobactin synthetase component D
MAQLGLPAGAIGRGPGGEPVWPSGVTGSITHKGEYVSAAVARATEVLSLGIDAEAIVSPEWAARIASHVMLPNEAAVGGSGLSPAVRLSLLFSIKEAVFKCLYPLVRRRFYYDALAVVEIDPAQGVFRAELQTPLPGFDHPRAELTGRVVLGPTHVHSAIWLPPRRILADSP